MPPDSYAVPLSWPPNKIAHLGKGALFFCTSLHIPAIVSDDILLKPHMRLLFPGFEYILELVRFI